MARPYAYTPRRRLVLQGVMVLLFGGTMLAAYGVASRRVAGRQVDGDSWCTIDRRGAGDGLESVSLPIPRDWGVKPLPDGSVGYFELKRSPDVIRVMRAEVRDRRQQGITSPEAALAELVVPGADVRAFRKVRGSGGVGWRTTTVRVPGTAATGPGTRPADDPTAGGRIVACAVRVPGVVVTVELVVTGRLPTEADETFLDRQVLAPTQFAVE